MAKTPKIGINLGTDANLARMIEAYRIQNRLPSETEAIRRLVEIGLPLLQGEDAA